MDNDELISKLDKAYQELKSVSEEIGDKKFKVLGFYNVDGLVQEASEIISKAVNILSILEEDISEI
ncbi:hypothetical protein [Carnobacterium divergens]|uniref:hypothetical protein n=1 Tax=Carnobacterium divergens TaxID=2748 RepID=UPI00288EB86C|nr:hypothetical protein [Carnobacterium divergens]MDT2010803.1 hypothetical protein [Carnobacterium divergens]